MLRCLSALLAGLLLLTAAPGASAALISVAAVPALTAAFKAAACGDEIRVAPGVYTKWRAGAVARDCSAAPVVITALDPEAPPVFAGGLTLDGWKGVTFRGVVCDIRTGGAAFAACIVSTGLSAAVTVEDSEIFGLSEPTTLASGAVELEGVGYGLAGKFSGLVVRRNRFHDLAKGMVVGDSERVSIADNDLKNITVDAIVFGGLIDGEILRNRIEKKPAPDASTTHADCIQGQKGSRPSLRVRIAFNLCEAPAAGRGTQGVFVADDPANDVIEVVGNTLLNTGYRALSAQGVGVVVDDNVALSQRTDSWAGLYWSGQSGTAAGNTVMKVASAPAGSLNRLVARATPAEIDAARAAWLARFRPDRKDREIAELRDQVAAAGVALAAAQAETVRLRGILGQIAGLASTSSPPP
jgi:hypothetical protein